MLKTFKFENCYCFKDNVSFNMAADMVKDGNNYQLKHTELDNIVRYPYGEQGILPVAAIYGKNASGKTNFIRTLHDVAEDVLGDSFSATSGILTEQPFEQILTERSFYSEGETVSYFICVVLKDIEYQLDYTIGLRGVVSEVVKIKKYGVDKEAKILYLRDGTNYKTGFDESINKYLELMNNSEEPRLWFSQIAPSHKDGLNLFYEWFRYVRDGLTFNNNMRLSLKWHQDIAKRLINSKDAKFKAKLIHLLKGLDNSIVDIYSKPLFSFIEENQKNGNLQQDRSQYFLFVEHKIDKSNSFAHTVEKESAGTKKLIEQFPLIYQSLEEGMPFICDELDRMLHPIAFKRIVKLFNSPLTNKKNAQLIFTAHDTIALDSDLLRRDEVHIVDKDEYSVSKIHRLSDESMDVEEYANMERDFRTGYYGSFPTDFLKGYEMAGEVNAQT